jgi:hypothetical protein
VVSFLSYVLERYIVSCVRAGLSRFDLQAKAQVDEREVTVEQFMQHQAAQVLTFPMPTSRCAPPLRLSSELVSLCVRVHVVCACV